MTSGQPSPLHGLSSGAMQDSGNTLYVVNPELVITYVNPVYLKFAEENGGTEIAAKFSVGCRILEVVQGPVGEFYAQLYRHCLQTGEVAEHEYECSSPDTYRKFCMHIFPLGESHGLMVDHALIVAKDHDRKAHPFAPGLYVDDEGRLHQCGSCRCVQNRTTKTWDWCPDALGRLKFVHGLCDECRQLYYNGMNGR